MGCSAALQKRLSRVAGHVGIQFKGFGFHSLRRSYASWRDELRISSRPEAGLVKDMGHADSRMTEHYVRGVKTGVVEQLQDLVFFSGKSGVSREDGSVN
jgi:integrase